MTTTTAPTPAGIRGPSAREQGDVRTRVRTRRADRPRPIPRRRISSLPFLALVAGLLGAGLLGLLIINNSLAAGSFEQSRLKSDRILLGEQEQALRQDVERLSSPTRVREAARSAGLIPAATTAYFDVTTGEILGIPMPAGQADPALPGAAVPEAPLVPDPTTGLPADPAAASAPTPTAGALSQPPARPEPGEADGAVVGGGPGTAPAGDVTAYDRAIVSGGGR